MIDLLYPSLVAVLIFALLAMGFLASTTGLSRTRRHFGYAVAGAAGAMATAYLIMSSLQYAYSFDSSMALFGMELARFIGYTLMWVPMIYVIGKIAGLPGSHSIALFVAIVGQLWITFSAWQFGAIPEVIVLISPVILLLGLVLLYGPLSTVARQRSNERNILFGKLKHIMALGWFGQVATVVVHPSTLGWTSAFTDWITIMYVEILLVAAFGAIVLNNVHALKFDGERKINSTVSSGEPRRGTTASKHA